ncbi:MAG: ABC transporter ATP-binding protein [Elusimicrobiota bacterium]|nr:ABC transporter ATP-binding protein [Elusimicrobiota bacterium]
MAEGKNYETMSLGTKTSYGLRQKISNNRSSFLFLDQPEDGIDSFTIYKVLNPLIKNKMSEECQIFMVTHNANFGINLDTNSVTIADFSNSNKPYDQIFDLMEKRQFLELQSEFDSPVAIFLEGSTESLKKRMKKLTIKENK